MGTDNSQVIAYNHVPNIILFGNGIHQAFTNQSWDKLIEKFKQHNESYNLSEIPNPLKIILISGDSINNELDPVSKELCEECPPTEEKEMWNSFCKLPFDSILTTNYSFEIEKSLQDDFAITHKTRSRYRKKTGYNDTAFSKDELSIFFTVPQASTPIWHIHGEAALPKTIILGHYSYGKLISAIEKRIKSLIATYHRESKNSVAIPVETWVDWFMLSNITIVGQGLDYSEFDLWWLIACKQKHFPETKIIWYEPNLSNEKKKMAEIYGINVISLELKDKDFKKYYETVFLDLKEKMTLQ